MGENYAQRYERVSPEAVALRKAARNFWKKGLPEVRVVEDVEGLKRWRKLAKAAVAFSAVNNTVAQEIYEQAQAARDFIWNDNDPAELSEFMDRIKELALRLGAKEGE